MQPGGFRYCCACLKAPQATRRQPARLRLYTRPLPAAQARTRVLACGEAISATGEARPGRRSIWPFSWEPIAKRGK
jgi:hypothetical protein